MSASHQLASCHPMMADLVADLHRTMARVEELCAHSTPSAVTELSEMACRLSEQLRELAASLLLDDPEWLRLLHLRDSLDSHDVAASALLSSDAPVAVVVDILRRGLTSVNAALGDNSAGVNS